jgi:aryl-alcohol dehydrogenase-like predicted oxidoreductase
VERRVLGRTGIKVSPLCLGTATLGRKSGHTSADAIRLVDEALAAGIDFIDTADTYGDGEAEELVGVALRGRRSQVVLSSKFGRRGTAHGSVPGRWVKDALEGSLRRLGTDWLDLYFVHRFDPSLDLEEILGAMTELVDAGKVRVAGCSSFPADAIAESHRLADSNNAVRFECEQAPYSLLVRAGEIAALPLCQEHGMGVVAWSPLASAGYPGDTAPVSTRRRARARRACLSGTTSRQRRTRRRSLQRRSSTTSPSKPA